ncbi:hypothetical protein [Cupriavidus necator]
MAHYLQIAVRAFSVSAIIVIVAIVSRQVYLWVSAEAGIADAEKDRTPTLLIRCEAMHSRLQNRHISEDAAGADEAPRARCMES